MENAPKAEAKIADVGRRRGKSAARNEPRNRKANKAEAEDEETMASWSSTSRVAVSEG